MLDELDKTSISRWRMLKVMFWYILAYVMLAPAVYRLLYAVYERNLHENSGQIWLILIFTAALGLAYTYGFIARVLDIIFKKYKLRHVKLVKKRFARGLIARRQTGYSIVTIDQEGKIEGYKQIGYTAREMLDGVKENEFYSIYTSGLSKQILDIVYKEGFSISNDHELRKTFWQKIKIHSGISASEIPIENLVIGTLQILNLIIILMAAISEYWGQMASIF